MKKIFTLLFLFSAFLMADDIYNARAVASKCITIYTKIFSKC